MFLGPRCFHIRFPVKELAHKFAYIGVAVFCQFLEFALLGFANPHIEAGGSLLAHYVPVRLLGVGFNHGWTVPPSSQWRQAQNELFFMPPKYHVENQNWWYSPHPAGN
jgi:hypothetical protein